MLHYLACQLSPFPCDVSQWKIFMWTYAEMGQANESNQTLTDMLYHISPVVFHISRNPIWRFCVQGSRSSGFCMGLCFQHCSADVINNYKAIMMWYLPKLNGYFLNLVSFRLDATYRTTMRYQNPGLQCVLIENYEIEWKKLFGSQAACYVIL